MKITRQFINSRIPALLIEPEKPSGAVVVAHGYGNCKEDVAGFAFRVAETRMAACCIDLRGHGENGEGLDAGVLDDVEDAVAFCRKFGKVTAIGHSLGGRLAMISGADFKIGISPAIKRSFGEETNSVLRGMAGYRVREAAPGAIFEILEHLPMWKPGKKNELIIYGGRDNPELITACKELAAAGENVVEVPGALHYDIYVVEETIRAVKRQIEKWNKG